MSESVDLGSGYSYRFVGWAPDRSIAANAERYEGIPDEPRFGAIIICPHDQEGMVTFEGEIQDKVAAAQPRWKVESWEPLTLSPSILRTECGCHGFIREGRWVTA